LGISSVLLFRRWMGCVLFPHQRTEILGLECWYKCALLASHLCNYSATFTLYQLFWWWSYCSSLSFRSAFLCMMRVKGQWGGIQTCEIFWELSSLFFFFFPDFNSTLMEMYQWKTIWLYSKYPFMKTSFTQNKICVFSFSKEQAFQIRKLLWRVI